MGTRQTTPISKQYYTQIATLAASVKQQFAKDEEYLDLLKTNVTPESWAKEGLDIVEKMVYKGVTRRKLPSEEYIAQGKEIVWMRLALGGKRLANLIEEIYLKLGKAQQSEILEKMF